MDGLICGSCHSWLDAGTAACPQCGTAIVIDGMGKNVIDRLQPDCLVHRYAGSDMLEPAALIKEGKANYKIATKLKEYVDPITVRKEEVFRFDQNTYSAIQALRNERTATIRRFDQLIESHWKHLKPYTAPTK